MIAAEAVAESPRSTEETAARMTASTSPVSWASSAREAYTLEGVERAMTAEKRCAIPDTAQDAITDAGTEVAWANSAPQVSSSPDKWAWVAP